jgi:hypothetical protein
MVLFEPIIEVAVRAVDNFATQHPAYRTRVGVMRVSGHLCGSVANHLPRLGEELPGRLHIPVFREHGINQVAVSINGTV